MELHVKTGWVPPPQRRRGMARGVLEVLRAGASIKRPQVWPLMTLTAGLSGGAVWPHLGFAALDLTVPKVTGWLEATVGDITFADGQDIRNLLAHSWPQDPLHKQVAPNRLELLNAVALETALEHATLGPDARPEWPALRTRAFRNELPTSPGNEPTLWAVTCSGSSFDCVLPDPEPQLALAVPAGTAPPGSLDKRSDLPKPAA